MVFVGWTTDEGLALNRPKAPDHSKEGALHMPHHDLIAAVLGLSFLASPALAQPIAPDILPQRIAGTGITVSDLETQKIFYTNVLGMKLVRTYERDGAVFEYILAIPSTTGEGAVLALLKGVREPGATTYGRMILIVPNADKLALALTAQGIPARKVAEGAYVFRDPENNAVEIFQPPQIVKP
jgi:catechol 2,3-dioxygenase-like lactoylglutathione lyase family enzyme